MSLYGPKELANSIREVRRNTIRIAENIHEDDYLFLPVSGSRSAAAILIHIAFFSNFDYLFHQEEHTATLEAFDLNQFLRDGERQENRPHTKPAIIALLKESGEHWAEWVDFLPERFLEEWVGQLDGSRKTRFEMILDTKEHELHLQGQLTLIERMLGLIPSCARNLREADGSNETPRRRQ